MIRPRPALGLAQKQVRDSRRKSNIFKGRRCQKNGVRKMRLARFAQVFFWGGVYHISDILLSSEIILARVLGRFWRFWRLP
jgi:hypothetical protein